MSQPADIAEITNRLIAHAVPGLVLTPISDFPRSAEGISILAAKLKDHFAGVRELYSTEKSLAETYSLVAFEKKVMTFIAPFVQAGTQVDKATVRKFLKEIVSLPVTEHDVYRPIYGVMKNRDAGPIVLGPFTIYNTASDVSQLDEAMRGRLSVALLDKTEHYLIRTSVQARELGKARELADALFERFEGAIRFILGPNNGFALTILTPSAPTDKRAIVLSGSTGSSEIGRGLSIPDLDIDDPYFMDAEVGYDRIWASFDSISNNELTKKLLLAVDWVGQSIAEKVPSSAFIKAAIALEVLLSPPKEFISASITSQIGESVAMLLGTDSPSRLRLESEAKRLYSIRSDVAHKGIAEVDSADVFAMQDMARGVVIAIFTAPCLQDVKSGADMQKIFKTMKYSCPAI